MSQEFPFLSKRTYRDFRLHLEVYQLFSPEQSEEWFKYLDDRIPWKHSLFKKDGTPTERRASQLFGDKDLIYSTNYYNTVMNREVIPWDTLPRMPELRDIATSVSGETFSVNIAQRYHTGRTGIEPHRDREMVAGTIIAGLSFGSTRKLQMSKCARWSALNADCGIEWSQESCSCNFFPGGVHSKRFLTISLPSGSMYIFRPPTNDDWLHCILKDESIAARISLTFRNYKQPTKLTEQQQRSANTNNTSNKRNRTAAIEGETSGRVVKRKCDANVITRYFPSAS
jgi:alkylated DNA repair dioxygenase AlkB